MAEAQEPAEVRICITVVPDDAGAENTYFRGCFPTGLPWATPPLNDAEAWRDVVADAHEETDAGQGAPARSKKSGKGGGKGSKAGHAHVDGDVPYVPRIKRWSSPPLALPRDAATAVALARAPHCVVFAGQAGSGAGSGQAQGEAEVPQDHYQWFCPLDVSPLLDGTSPPVVVACGRAPHANLLSPPAPDLRSATPPRKSGRKGTPPASAEDDTAPPQAPLTLPDLGLPTGAYLYTPPSALSTCVISVQCVGDPLLPPALREELNPLTLTVAATHHLPGTTLSQPTPGQVRAFLCPNRYSHTASVCQAPRLVGRLFGAALPELDRLILTPRVQWSELTSRVTPADPAALVGSTPFTAAAADDSDSSDDEAEAHGQAGEVADSRESLTAFPRIAWSHRTTVLLGTAPADSVREALLTHPLTLRLHDRDAAQAALDEGAGPLPAPRRPDPAELESIPQDPADADQAAAGAVGAVDVSGTGQLGACAWPATAARLGALLSHLVQDQGADSAPSHPAALPESAPVPTPPPPGVTAPWAALARVDAAAAWEVLSDAALSSACHPHGIARLRCEGLLDSSAAAHRALTAAVAQGAAQRASLDTAAQQQQQQAAAQRRLSQFHSRGGVAAAPDAGAGTVAQPAETDAATATEAPSCISLSASVDMLPRRRTAVPRGGEDAPGLSPAQALARDTAAYTAVGCRTVVSFSLARPLEAGVTGAAAATGSNTNTVGRCVLVTRYQDDSALRQVNALLQSLNTARMTAHLTHEQAAKAAAAAAAAATSARASPRGKGKRSGRKQRSPRDDEKAAAAAAAAAEAAAREVMAQTASAARPGIAGVQVERLAAVELAPEETAAVHAGDLDILTAWQVVDRHWRIFVVEGREVVRGAAGPELLAPGEDGVTPIVAGSGDGTVRPVFAASMQVLRAVLGRQWANSAQRKLLSNPDVRWRERLYVGTNLTLDTTHLGRRLARIVQGLDTYSADPARSTAEAATAARKLFELRRAQRLWTLKQCRLFPTRRELAALALREGATVTHEDMEGRVARQADIDASLAGLGAAAGRRGTTLPSSIADTSTAWGGGGAPAEGGGGDTTVASQTGAPPPTRRSTSRTSRKEATVTTFREYDALSSALATARQGVDFLQRNKDAVGHLSAQLTSALEATGQSRAQQRQLPPDVLQAMQAGQAFSYSGQSRSVMQAQRAAHTAMAARDTKHAYVYADSSAAGGLLGATVPRADPDTEAATEAAAAAAAALTPSGFAYPKPTPIAQKRRHAKAPQDAHSAAFREPYMDAAEQAARQREAERQQVLAVGGHRPGWGHAPMVGREFGYKNPATGEDESARFNTSVHAASHAAKQVAEQTARAEAEAWAQRVVVDAKQVKWRGHSTPHAAPGTADKYKPLLADAPATLALRAAHAAKTPSGKVHALYEDRLAVDTVHRDAGASQEHLHTSTQALHPAQPPHDAAKLAASASAGSLRDAGLRAISALAGQQGVTPLALSFRGRTPDGPSNASLTSGAGAGLTRRGAWASGLLKSPQLATATGLSPRRQTSGAGPFSPIVTSQSRSAADVLHKPHIQPLPTALRSGPQWG